MKKTDDNENEYWDKISEEYADEIMSIQPIFYKNSGRKINNELKKGHIVADIGNGGVINYLFDDLERLDCVDLSLSNSSIKKYSNCPNVNFLEGNVFHLNNIQDEMYDRVILQCVIHHLAGHNYLTTEANVKKALKECARITKKNGELLIVESVVVPWFEKVERFLYAFMQLFFRIIRFDTVYQFSAPSLIDLINGMDIGKIVETERIEIGKYMWLLKHKVPNKITPCRAVWICIRK
ncbi:MAG: class I SAM-dependent methyltransferase [Lachnospiraceae bacterium]|nr:class I SAM-dependent methyltransferase [Lachnospiraceae bacterium]